MTPLWTSQAGDVVGQTNHTGLPPMNQIIVLSAILIAPSSAFAYIDPGTGSMALQAAIAAVAGTMVGLRAGWDRLKAIVSRKHADSPTEQSSATPREPADRV